MNTTDTFEAIKRKLRQKFSQEQRHQLRRYLAEPLSYIYRRNLRRLAQIYGSDKWGNHWYCQHYERHFSEMRNKPLTLLEIGIGGYDDPRSGGRSLRMWRRYFRRGRIYGIDLADKSPHNARRIRTFRGDQTDCEFLCQVIAEIGKPDIIIDDGSHINSHVISTFEFLFPLLADNGVYVVEDTQTSYWPEFGGSSEGHMSARTSMGFLKGLIDGLNHAEYKRSNFIPCYYDKWIVSMHFYHNLVFVYKGMNNEQTNDWDGRNRVKRPSGDV